MDPLKRVSKGYTMKNNDWKLNFQRKQIWTIVFLVGAYIFCQAIADVAATKFVVLWGIVLPAGSIIFALTFTLRDLVHKRLGKEWARACIFWAGVNNVFMAGYLLWMARLPAPAFYTNAAAWSAIFNFVPSIVLGSIVAEVTSELVDTEVYHWTSKRFNGVWQFMRVLISNAVSLPLDSFIFGTLAFVVLPHLFGAQAVPFVDAMALVVGQIMFKAVVTGISLPTIYFVKENPLIHSA